MRGSRDPYTTTHHGHSCRIKNISNSQADDAKENNNYIHAY